MPKFRVDQLVLCEVKVWYNLEADTMEDALNKVAEIKTPTCAVDVDWEITSDQNIITTSIKECGHEF